MTDWGRLFVVILNRGDETPAQFSNYLPSWERTENNNEFWIIFFFFIWSRQVAFVQFEKQPILSWDGGQGERVGALGCRGCPWGAVLGVVVQGLGAARRACPGHPHSSPLTLPGASSQGRGSAQICLAPLDRFTKASKKPGESKIQEVKIHS